MKAPGSEVQKVKSYAGMERVDSFWRFSKASCLATPAVRFRGLNLGILYNSRGNHEKSVELLEQHFDLAR